MKKLVAALATGVMVAGISFTTVSAETYEVKNGDSLWSIAEEYNTSVDKLLDINKMNNPMIHPNQELLIQNTYTVKKGDTLDKISKNFDVSVSDIKKWNELDSDLIVIGQELELKDADVSEKTRKQVKEEKTETKQKSSKDNKETKSQEKEETTQSPKKEKASQSDKKSDGKTISVSATAYTAKCKGCSGVTSTGVDLNANPDAKVIAVDPSVIPLGSEVYVEGYGYATAADVGGAIKGNKIDVHVPTNSEAKSWGVQNIDVTIIE